MNLIVKKVKGFYGNKNGLIQPLFKIDQPNNVSTTSNDEYANNGYILVGDYELLDQDINNEIFLIEDGWFIQEDNLYSERQNEPNASKWRVNYNTRISNYFKDLVPTKFIPIYDNKFQLDNHRLINADNITSEIFFLKNTILGEIYGPFERDNFDLKAAKFQNYENENLKDESFKDFIESYTEYDGCVIYQAKIDKLNNLVATDNQGRQYMIDFVDFLNSKITETVEFTPFPLLHKWALEKLKIKHGKINDFLNDVKIIESSINTNVDKLRWIKYLQVLNEVSEDNTIIQDIVQTLYNRGFINDIAESSELANLKKELDEAIEDINVKNKEIIQLKDEREDLALQLKESGVESNDVDSSNFPLLSDVLKQPEKFPEIEDLIKNSENFISLENDILKLNYKKEFFTDEIKKLEESKRKIEESVRLIKQNFDNDVSIHTAKLGEAKIYTDLLNGINITSQNFENKAVETAINTISLNTELSSARAYVIEIQKRLKNLGRDFSFNEIANIIITTNQSFLTIIAGAPGVGKTSLVEKLAQSYGLKNGTGYLEINCARGWTSSKDLLGFHNPLTNKYQQSKTKLKDALEISSNNKSAPYIVLLDEANLSPMEHYWSDFIKLADLDYQRLIQISERETIHFADGFKFIATINHDHTTESLSNRLLDRSAVIQLEKTTTLSESIPNIYKEDSVYNFHEIQKIFIETSKWKSDEELIKKFLNQIKERIESSNTGIVVSPRKELAIRKYCKVATGLLEGNSYTALDYAVAQHILPLINGRGDQFENNLKILKNELQDKGMIKSEKLLARILDRGKDFKHFKYIYY